MEAPPDTVWSALTDPDQVVAWLWPHLDNTAEIDLSPGGQFRFTGPKGNIAVTGHYLEVARPLRLAFSWRWEGETRVSQVAVELHPEAETTLLTLVHIGLADKEERDSHVEGWTNCLDRLEVYAKARAIPG